MTDVSSRPFTGPSPAPMFATDPQPVANPSTEPHEAPIFDTGPHPDPLPPAAEATPAAEPEYAAPAAEPELSAPQAFSELETVDTDAFRRAVTAHPVPGPVPAAAAVPVAVPGAYQFVKRWRFALILAGVWVLAAAAGAGFYHWWYTALSKTLPVFGILIFLVVCMLASLLVSMVADRPQLTALAIALMAAPLAALGAAAVLHGAYYFEWIARPAIG